MLIPPNLSNHVRDALIAGRAQADIRAELRAADWTETEIDAALSGWMRQDGGGAVPRPMRSTAARDALFYALLFVVFGMVVGNTLVLLFAQINLWLPEPNETRTHARISGLRWSMAALIVFVPLFWFLDRRDRKASAVDPARRHGTVRRWLSMIAMLGATITLLGDAIFLIYSWLDGQITQRFLVKSATVALMALVVLTYFRETRALSIPWASIPSAWVLIVTAMLSLGLSFWVVGGPTQGRMECRDRVRVSDLQTLANDVARCPTIDRTALPETLDPMTCARNPARLTGFANTISYERLGPTEFYLCTEVEDISAINSGYLVVDDTRVCVQRQTN